jgi:uncharacterized protein (DUF1501 family)
MMTVQTNGKTKDPVLVVVQLSGGNDFMNTVIPFTKGIYYDNRPLVGIAEDKSLPFTDTLAWHPSAAAFKRIYEQGKMAIVQGVGTEHASRSHFRAMDIWHTCEPEIVATEGWLAKVIKEIDPDSLNPVTAVNFGRGLPRALAAPGVVATSIGDLDKYGLMSGIELQEERDRDLQIFQRMYTPAIGSGQVMNYLSQTGNNVLTGADMLAEAPRKYKSTVEYADNPIAKALRDVVRVHTAGLGTRIFYTNHAGYDHHAQEVPTHARLLTELTDAIEDFMEDLREHDAADEVNILVFTEFGRRIKDNGSGTDHGTGGGAFLIGENVKGGLYSEYPSLAVADWKFGEDMDFTIDFRSIYSTILNQWMGLDPIDIVGGSFEQFNPYKKTMV